MQLTFGKRIAIIFFSCFLISQAVEAQERPKLKKAMENGAKLYEQHCLACHQSDGSGVPNLTPPLIHTSFVTGDKVRLIKIILKGMQGEEVDGETYDNPMPAFDYLKDDEIADLLTYIRNNFSNKADPVFREEVEKVRRSINN